MLNDYRDEDLQSTKNNFRNQSVAGDAIASCDPCPETICDGIGSKCEPLAIIGMACRLPGGVTSPSKLWDLLIERRSGHCEIPDTRFNIDSFYHSDPDRPGCTNSKGGYYLSEDIASFENQFFGINNREATSMDPQQRKLLEVVYECFEDAGMGLQSLAGANVGCYVGNFTADFSSLQLKDPELFTRYSATGMGATILANRLTHVFDLRGPSLVLDTACSSSLYCLHVACMALESKECDAAIVAGVNLIQGPEHHLATTKAGILSASSTCHTFDASADGYGRADGVGALYVKRLSDAIRDGDPIRSVVRATAVNSNGRTNGITLPSANGQEEVIRKAYAKARLDVNSTDYVECHGTGTAVGDPIEVEALARVFSDSHSKVPLLIGSAKTNLGHSEAASGITSIIKTTLALEKGVIPATIGLRKLNPKIKAQEWNVKVVTETCPWPQHSQSSSNYAPRASVNSFGYGGANAHAILESASAHIPRISSSSPTPQSDHTGSSFILPFSASNHPSLQDKVTSLLALDTSSISLRDLAHTLGSRRTHLAVRGYLTTDHLNWRSGLKLEDLHVANSDGHPGQLSCAFVFSGQGAQWPEMGRHLIEQCPSFKHTIRELDGHLSNLPLPPEFSIHDAILEPAETSKVNSASYSQPICTAIQIALVDLLAKCNLLPTAVVGHSSGEICAAYAAGHVTANEAIEIAYYRGYAMSQNLSQGTMVVVGLNQLAAEEFIVKLEVQSGVFVACVNSPESVTLSGDAHEIDTLLTAAQAQGVFARTLMTDGKAYHSPYMKEVGARYEELISTVFEKEPLDQGRMPAPLMISTVTASIVGSEVTRREAYWRSNLESPVLFQTALELLAQSSQALHFIEIGPHSALELPIKQTLERTGPISYLSTLSRAKNGIVTMLSLVGNLFLHGHTIAFGEVNSLFLSESESTVVPKVLRDLPTHQWLYESKLWTEPRISEDYRHRQHSCHDLLGTQLINGSSITSTWRNLLNTATVQWLQDHKLGQSIVMPGAAYLAMAAEASSQLAGSLSAESAIVFHRVDIIEALTIPTTDAVELFTELRSTSISNITILKGSWDFTIFSHSKGATTMHAKGLVRVEKPVNSSDPGQPEVHEFSEPLSPRTLYDKFAKAGLVYGPSFQSLSEVYSSRANDQPLTRTKSHLRKTESTGSKQESEYRIHPVVIDAVLQTGLIADGAGSILDLRPCVPVFFDRVSISPCSKPLEAGTIYAEAQRVGFGASTFDARLCDHQNHNVLELHGVRMVTYPGLDSLLSSVERHPFLRVTWKPDIATFWSSDINNFPRALHPHKCCNEGFTQEVEILTASLDLIAHKKPTARILELASDIGAVTERSLDILRAQTAFRRFQSYTLGSIGNRGQLLGRQIRGIADREEEGSCHQELNSDQKFDVVVLPTTESTVIYLESYFQTLISHAAPGAVFLFVLKDASLPPRKTKDFGMVLSYPLDSGSSICLTRLSEPLRIDHGSRDMTFVLVHDGSTRAIHTTVCAKIEEIFKAPVNALSFVEVSEATLPSDAIVIATVELETPMLKAATDADLTRLKLLVERASTIMWITGGGLLHGKRPDFALYAGLARAVQLEQPSLKLLALDVDDFISDPNTLAVNIISVLDQSLHDLNPDYEYISHNGCLYVSRFTPDEIMNKNFNHTDNTPKATVSWKQAGHCQLAIERVGQFNTLHFEQEPGPEKKLEPDWIEVQVKFVGLNAKDVYALGGKVDTKSSTCTLEFCGIVTKTGLAVTDLALGDRVVVSAPGHFRAYEHVPSWACQKLQDGEDFAAACTLMIVFQTALYGLQNRANLQAGESVLIHSASGGAGIAAIQIAKLIGAEIFATAGTADKKHFLVESMGLKRENIFNSRDSSFLAGILEATNGRGVDVVFNSLTGNLLHDSWQACSDFGRFVEIGKRDIQESGKLEMQFFNRGTTFTAFDLTEIFYSTNSAHHRLYHKLSRRVLELYRAGKITAVQPLKVFDVSDIVSAIRYFSSTTRMGKVAVSLEDPNSQITFRPARYTAVLDSEKSYIMVGCLGGLGRSLSKWMFDRGARNFVFIGRSGTEKASAKTLVNSLREAGATVVVVKGDVSCLNDVNHTVKQSPSPIGGIIQAAMGLNESLFTNMSEEYWHSGIDAKVLGTWNLHTAMTGKDDQLDFFIMTSSVSGSIGTATEGNYCASNHFLDNFAKYRRHLGLPAISLGLGMISEVGYLHEHPEIEELLLRKGIRPINKNELLSIFDSVLSESRSVSDKGNHFTDAHLLTGLEATGLQAQRDQGFDGHRQVIDDPRASVLLQSFNESSPQLNYSANPGKVLSSKVKEIIQSGGNLRDTVHNVIAEKMSNLILLPADKINPNTPLSSFGMDSMLAAELRTYIYQAFRVDVPFQTLMGKMTDINSVADVITGEVGNGQEPR